MNEAIKSVTCLVLGHKWPKPNCTSTDNNQCLANWLTIDHKCKRCGIVYE